MGPQQDRIGEHFKSIQYLCPAHSLPPEAGRPPLFRRKEWRGESRPKPRRAGYRGDVSPFRPSLGVETLAVLAEGRGAICAFCPVLKRLHLRRTYLSWNTNDKRSCNTSCSQPAWPQNTLLGWSKPEFSFWSQVAGESFPSSHWLVFILTSVPLGLLKTWPQGCFIGHMIKLKHQDPVGVLAIDLCFRFEVHRTWANGSSE